MDTIASSIDRRPSLFQHLVRTVGRTWRWMTGIFRRGDAAPTDPNIVFTKIDVEGLKQRLRLAEQAERFGRAGLPAHNALDLDGPQRQVLQHLKTELAEGFRRTNTRLTRLWSALRARDVTEMVQNLESLPARRQKEIEVELSRLNTELERDQRLRDRTQRELEEYRTRYGLREPDLKSSVDRRKLLTFTILVALLQALANTVFFAEGATYGIAAGLTAAVLLGLADVFIHTWGGRLASAVRAPEWWLRLPCAGLILALVASVLLWNLGIVHLRNGVRLHGFQEGSERWLTNFVQDPVGFTDFYSYALLAIGLVCSISAVAAGLTWDEPVPRLRKLGRRLEEAQADVEDTEESIAELQQEWAEDLREECEQERARIQHNLNMADALFRDIRGVHENLMAHVVDAKHAFETLIQFYRDENLLARAGVASPPYFQQAPAFDMSIPLEVNLSEMREFVERQHQVATRVLSPERSVAVTDAEPREARA